MSNNSKILLITAGTMDYITGGTVMYRKFLKHIPRNQLCWAVAGGWSNKVPLWMSDRDRLICYSPLFNRLIYGLIRRMAYYRLGLHNIWFWYAYKWFPQRAAKKITEFAVRQKVTKIWVHATGPAIGVAIRVQRSLNLPIHVNIQDDIDGPTGVEEGKWLRKDFVNLLQNSTTSDVTCLAMKDYYISKYDTCHDAFVLWNGSVTEDIPEAPTINAKFKYIGYGGFIWSYDAINICLSALEILNAGRHSEDIIMLRIYSKRLKLNHPYIQYMGLLDTEQIIPALQECDLLYVPMSFLPRYHILSSTSLPGKILTYMQTQIPILAHGPTYASNVEFVGMHQIGITCTSTEPKVLAAIIEKYEHEIHYRVKASNMSLKLCKTKFDSKEVWQKFQAVLFEGA
jgi:hypothetical protein